MRGIRRFRTTAEDVKKTLVKLNRPPIDPLAKGAHRCVVSSTESASCSELAKLNSFSSTNPRFANSVWTLDLKPMDLRQLSLQAMGDYDGRTIPVVSIHSTTFLSAGLEQLLRYSRGRLHRRLPKATSMSCSCGWRQPEIRAVLFGF